MIKIQTPLGVIMSYLCYQHLSITYQILLRYEETRVMWEHYWWGQYAQKCKKSAQKWSSSKQLKESLPASHMELYSILCGSLDGREVWGRMNTRMCMAESLRWSSETITALLIGYAPTQNLKKKFKEVKKKIACLISLPMVRYLAINNC